MKNFRQHHSLPVILVCLILALLAVPPLVWFSFNPIEYSARTEDDLFSSIDKYYMNNFPFRKQIITIYHGINSMTRLHPTADIAGNAPNWFFLLKNCESFTKQRYFTSSEKENISDKLQRLKSYFEKRKINFIILIIPDKIQIYPEFLPESIRKKQSGAAVWDDLMEYLEPYSGIIKYPKKLLVANKPNGLLYYPNDTHWTMKGAYIVFRETAALIDPELHLPELQWQNEKTSFGDLGLAFPYEISCPVGIPHRTTHDIQHAFDVNKKNRVIITPDALSKKKILLFHDSFFISMEPFMHRYFYKTHQVAAPINYDLIEQEKPDFVILQMVERNTRTLLSLKMPPNN